MQAQQCWTGSGRYLMLDCTSGQLQWAAIASHSHINKPRPLEGSRMAAVVDVWRMAPINRLVRWQLAMYVQWMRKEAFALCLIAVICIITVIHIITVHI